MRAVDADLAAAIEAAEQAPRAVLKVDWDVNGYGPAGSYDDLSPLGATINCNRALTGDIPEEVRVVTGYASAEVSADLVAGDVYSVPATITYRSLQYGLGAQPLASIPIPPPAGTLAGDYLLAAVSVADPDAMIGSDPAWDILATTTTAVMKTVIMGRRATATEPANYTWTFSPATQIAIGIVCFAGAGTHLPGVSGVHAVAQTAETVSGTGHATPTVDVVADGCQIVTFHAWLTGTSGTWTPPAGMTERIDIRGSDPATNIALEVATENTLVGPGSYARTATSSAATATATMAIVVLEPVPAGDERAHGARYFSRFNRYSPLYGKERLARPASLAVEYPTATGPQQIPRATLRTRALPVSAGRRQATLSALDYREKLRKKVVLPALVATEARVNPTGTFAPGLESTWVVSYILWQNGVYPSPAPRSGCRAWIPMHGSAAPMIANFFDVMIIYAQDDDTHTSTIRPVDFQPGPFLLACENGPSGGHVEALCRGITGPTMFTNAGRSAVRIEAWAKLTSSSTLPLRLSAIGGQAGECNTRLNINSFGVLVLEVINGATTRTVTGPAIQLNGEWQFIGVHVDDAAGSATFRIGATNTTVGFTTTPANSSVVDTMLAYIYAGPGSAVAEVQFTAGLAAGDPWLNSTPFTAAAVVDRSQNKLNGVVVTAGRDSWELLAEIAAAEFAAIYFDEDGIFHYAGLARLISDQAQTVQRTLTSEQALTDLAYDDRIDAVRNVVTCAYQPAELHSADKVWEASDKVFLTPGATRVFQAQFSAPVFDPPLGVLIRANTLADGSGTDKGDLVGNITYTSALSATLTVRNPYYFGVWLVDTTGKNTVVISSLYISQGQGENPPEWRDDASIAVFGEQPLDLSGNPWRQRIEFAAGIAMIVCTDLRQPRQPLTGLDIIADPRLQFFDRVHVADPDGTLLDAPYWVTSVDETISSRGYVMRLAARQARDVHIVGQSPVGEALVGSTIDDYLQAALAAWTSYTPVWTGSSSNPAVGNGSISGAYRRLGKTVDFRIRIVMGSTTTYGTGQWLLSLPFTPAADTTAAVFASDNSAGFVYPGSLWINAANNVYRVVFAGGNAGASSTVPFTWATNDILEVAGTYETSAA